MRRDALRAKYSARDCTAEGQRGSLPADEISGTKGRDPACVRRSNLRLAIQPVSIKPQNHALFPFAPGRGLLLSTSSQIDRILEAYLGRSAQKLHPLFADDGKHGRLDSCLCVLRELP